MSYKDKDKQREFGRIWMAKRRKEWIDENGPCKTCGSWDQPEVDHIDPSTKLYNPGILWGMSKTNPKRIAELEKCQVLCCDCHLKKTKGELMKTHCKYGHSLHDADRRPDGTINQCRTCRILSHREKRRLGLKR